MFKTFEVAFQPDPGTCNTKPVASSDMTLDDELRTLFSQYGGTSFNHGLYRIFSVDDVSYWNGMVLSAFPSFSGRVTCFAIDWLGRVFATDTGRLEGRHPGIVMFEPGTAEVLEIPCNVANFHDNELIQFGEEALAASFYQQWIDGGGIAPSVRQCIGYKKPLYLGGADSVDNLEVSDLDVYWTLSSQLIQKTRGLSPGTVIGSITLA